MTINPARWVLLLAAIAFLSVAANPQTRSTTDWPTAFPAQSGLSDARLRALDAAIRSAEFKKIGSVLISRHGKLAYESYLKATPQPSATPVRRPRASLMH